jgi:hypothetical protein
MDNNTLIVLAAVVVVALAAGGLLLLQRRTARLRQKFGSEYERVVEESGGKSKAESRLQDRTKRMDAIAIQPLRPEDRMRFVEAWRKVQADFVDSPKDAVGHADALLTEIMSTRGYPTGDFEQRSADLSVDHPAVVQNYRAGHAIALRQAAGGGDTEELRQAMIHYRALFDDLVGEAAPAIQAKAS